ncbi:MAG: type IV toxin-antitoxin system AbiEi family antitoxin [Bacteroidales bacterium]|nr:type IV toxin-antitoxin system AbiEi family antitoxin [Bacteroidales bacterium]
MVNEILNNAVQKLIDLAGLECKIIKGKKSCEKQSEDNYLEIKTVNSVVDFKVVIKSKFVPTQILMLKESLVNFENSVLVSDYISAPAKKTLKENNINYIDTIGNVFIKAKDLFVFVEVNKTNRADNKTVNRAFKTAGLKVIFQFLIEPECVNLPYRQIAERTNVAIDTISKVIKELLKEKYIVKADNKNYKFVDKKRLFEDWSVNYSKNLKQKLKQKSYRFLDTETDFKTIVLPEITYWGGAYAAEILTKYLNANSGIIYTGLDFQELMKELRLLPDNKGNITVVEKFWTEDIRTNTVNPMLVFADLTTDNDQRLLETANLIYKDYVENNL